MSNLLNMARRVLPEINWRVSENGKVYGLKDPNKRDWWQNRKYFSLDNPADFLAAEDYLAVEHSIVIAWSRRHKCWFPHEIDGAFKRMPYQQKVALKKVYDDEPIEKKQALEAAFAALDKE